MDTSEEYRRMCDNIELKRYKYNKGFEEGDFVYAHNKLRVVGHDMLCISKNHKPPSTTYYRFALAYQCPPTPIIETDPITSEVTTKYGEYRVDTIKNPIWIPRQDQLIDMVYGTSWHDFDEQCKSVADATNARYCTYITKEHAGLIVVMRSLAMVNTSWNYDLHEWDDYSLFGSQGGVRYVR